MDMFKSIAGSGDKEKPSSETPKSGFVATAKSVPEAAQSTVNNVPGQANKTKASAAGAAADALDTAKNYAKLDDKQGVGQYIEKAEEYLRKSSNDTTTAPAVEAEKSAPPAKKAE